MELLSTGEIKSRRNCAMNLIENELKSNSSAPCKSTVISTDEAFSRLDEILYPVSS